MSRQGKTGEICLFAFVLTRRAPQAMPEKPSEDVTYFYKMLHCRRGIAVENRRVIRVHTFPKHRKARKSL
jgi:hypothetical protein